MTSRALSRGRKLLRHGRIVSAALLLVAAGCGGPAPSPSVAPGTPVATGTADARIAGWSADIDALLSTREAVHPDPWHGLARTDWIKAADDVKSRLAGLNDDEAFAALVRLAAMPSWNGRDGHTGIFTDSGTCEYPVRFWRFSDGFVITAARAPYDGLVGSRVTAIDGHPIDDVLALVEPLAPRDNPSNLLAYGPLYLRMSELLAGLGVIERPGPATFSVVDRAGATHDVAVEPISAGEDIAWNSGQPHRLPPTDALWLKQQATNLWWTYLDDSRTVYVEHNAVEGGVATIAEDILARVEAGDVDRVVVDLRNNGGGDNTTMGRLEVALRDPAIDRPGRLFILIGRLTFSAAANFATDLEQTTGAIFVGEDMGGSPNLYGDARPAPLPYSRVPFYVATRYWQRSAPGDPRITIEPDIAAGMSSDDYFTGRDPVLDAALGAPIPTN